KQHGKIDTILRIHFMLHPESSAVYLISIVITDHYIHFAMLFMQLWGKVTHDCQDGVKARIENMRSGAAQPLDIPMNGDYSLATILSSYILLVH
ncbi:MAG: hypothetical protein LJE94_10185, partial [Deltaproteobacteria bacterium]|nr:hypothetical protein [Deltaproteobacteria bacterium]